MTTVYDITHGAGGLWEVFLWDDLFELNTQAGRDRIRIDRITGLHSLPDTTDPRAVRVGRIGENTYPSSFAGKTVVIEGEIVASSVALLRAMRTEFVAAFADTISEHTMGLVPQASAYHVSPTAYFTCKVLALEVGPEEQISNQYTRPFVLSLRLADPRIYYPALGVDVTGDPAAFTNAGDAPVDPVLRVAGASGDVAVSDGTHTLTFRNCPSGTLDIDFVARTAKVGAAHVELVVSASDWWDSHVPGIPPGPGSISQIGGTSVRVMFDPATWG